MWCHGMHRFAVYAQNGNVDEALKLFQKIPAQHMASWNTMFAECSQNRFFIEAVRLFKNIPERNVVGIKPVAAWLTFLPMRGSWVKHENTSNKCQ